MNLKYLGASLLCGGAWGLIALAMGHAVVPERELWTGVLSSPLIGLLVGVVSSPAYSFPLAARMFLPPFFLYFSALLFAMAMSLRGDFNVDLQENLGGVMYGTTIYLPMLLPLAYLTHFGLGRLRSRPAKPD